MITKNFLISFLLFSYLCLNSPSLFSQEKISIQSKISRISVTGNEYFSNDQIQNMMVLKSGSLFTKEQFELDLKNLVRNYQKEGFLNSRIDKTEKTHNFDSSSVSLSIHLEEGKQVFIGNILFEGNKSFTTNKLLSLMFTKSGKILNTSTLNQDIEQILNKYEEKGFTFASISIKDISTYYDGDREKIKVVIKIDENEKINIDNVIIEGNTSTKKDVILREIRLGKKNVITRESIFEIKRRLDNLGYFESVEQPKIFKYKSSTVLLIKVKEGNTNTFDGILGYVPPSDNQDKGYFTGMVDLSLRNLFGTGRRLDARWQKEVKTTQELELKYLEPWVLGYPLNVNIGFLQRIQDSIFVKRNVNLKSEVILSKNFTGSILVNFERVIPSHESNQSSSGGIFFTVFDSRLISTGIEIKFDNRDYVYNPASGFFYRTSYSVGQKKIYNASSFQGFNIPQDFTVQRVMIDLELYHSFFKRQSTLIGLHGGEVKSSKLENADYFRFGGIQSVRGYRDEQFLASRVAWSNLELRYSLTRKSFAALFYDFGYYRKPQDEIVKTPEQKGFIFGYGLGVRVETVLGIFGVSYALGRGDGLLEGKVHFGFINDF